MSVRTFFKRLLSSFLRDGVDDVAAMMTYYAIFALFPMLIFILSLTLFILPPGVLQDAIDTFGRALPIDIFEVVNTQVVAAQEATDGNVALIGGLVALWGASRGTAALTGALNRVFSVRETRSFWWRQLLAILVTAGVAMLVVLALGLLLLGPWVGRALGEYFELGTLFDTLWTLGQWLGAGVLMTFVWSLLYKLLPNHHAPLRVFTPGAAVGVLLWVGISRVMTFFLERFTNFEATYGALATAVTFLLWLWLSNLALLIGAEISDILHGGDVRQQAPAPVPYGRRRTDVAPDVAPMPPTV